MGLEENRALHPVPWPLPFIYFCYTHTHTYTHTYVCVYIHTHTHIYIFFFLAALCGMWDLSSPPRDLTCAPVGEAWSLNHWTSREVPTPTYEGSCLITKLHLTLWWPHGLVAHQTPLSMGFPRHEYWSGLPFPSLGVLPDPGIKSAFPEFAGRFFTIEPRLRTIWKEMEKLSAISFC